MKTLDEILAIIGIEPDSKYDTNYTNVKKMFVEWGRGIIGEDERKDPTHVSNQFKPYLREKRLYRNQLRAEQRACIEKEGKV